MTARTRNRRAALLATSLLAAGVLGACGTESDPAASDPEPQQSASSKPAEESSPAAPSDTATTAPETVAVPLYFVGDTPLGPRLFREFQQVEGDNPVDEALAILASGAAQDPDYSTLLPGGTPTLVAGETPGPDGAIGVNVPTEWAERPDGMSEKEAKLAVQQLVYTVQGALQSRAPVEFYSDGVTPMFGIDRSWFKAAPQNSVLAFVNITEPAEGAQVSGTFTASGVANSFEATVPWEIQDQSGTKVLDGFATADGWGDRLHPWQAPVDVSGLAAGTYTFVASTDDASDGEGGGPTKDTKTITVG
ncbi:MAG TPA: Gmad2 immunoglobulin-like domain-containing protein [Nocardioides sp.]|uniref:Gmad2 immunoglobulin-like domain-containing protein n=1 Tax=uncultured Nocardioides sp. TaxID=198441 RepID=UPI002634BAEF|nr:Gmad2 immunoglobulin-like domain-containing protein [uncultured Nocardioides sp.]HRI97226.1 Gmad2 immunoglobulin-like domain-containing protein [Nocardioides sp.]